MGLNDLNSIDFVLGPTPHAKVTLIIADGGTHPDEETRFNKVAKKLGAYAAYVVSPAFWRDHPGVEPKDVLIGVMSKDPPTEAMQQMTSVRPHARRDVSIRVACAQHKLGAPMPWFVGPDGKRSS